MKDTDPTLNAPQIDLEDPAIRDQLREMTQATAQPGVLFGRDFAFTQEGRDLALGVAEAARTRLQPHLEANKAEWEQLQTLADEGNDKGILFSMADHPGTFVPTWCVDAGPDAPVHKVRSDEGRPLVAVSTELFGLFDWMETVKAVETTSRSSDDLLNGRTTKQLGVPLGRLSHLLSPEVQA